MSYNVTRLKISLWLCGLCSAVSKLEKDLQKELFQDPWKKSLKTQIGLMAPLNHESRIKVNPHYWSCYPPLGSTNSLQWYFRRTSDHFEAQMTFLPIVTCAEPHSCSFSPFPYHLRFPCTEGVWRELKHLPQYSISFCLWHVVLHAGALERNRN